VYRSTDYLDVVRRAVSSAYWTNSLWWRGVGILYTYKLKRTREVTPPPAYSTSQEATGQLLLSYLNL
jgi:hypothetical protein